mmetsp:Transcript_28487/g.48391  ORF Transcript_28487/g.48391 Transcript_28487/m.48391 type:complete len:273 (+) Transcript_28487:603-1421(+)
MGSRQLQLAPVFENGSGADALLKILVGFVLCINIDPMNLDQRGGVHKIHTAVHGDAAEESLQETGCHRGQIRILGDPTHVQANGLDLLFCELHHHTAELLGNAEQVLHGVDQVGLHRGDVEGSMRRASVEHLADLFTHVHRDLHLGLLCRRPQMGGGDDVVALQQGGLLGKRLGGEHVEGSSGDVSALDGLGNSRFIHALSTSHVGQDHTLLHCGNGRGVDNFLRLLDGRQVQSDNIGSRKDFAHLCHGDMQLGSLLGSHKRIISHDLHAES